MTGLATTARGAPARVMAPGHWTFTVFLGALSALPPLSIDMGLPGIPAMEGSLAGAGGRGALTLTVFLAGFAVSPLAGGPLADRFGRRATLVAGLLAFAAAAAACMAAASFPALLLCRLVQGIAAGACVLVPLAVVRDVFDGGVARHYLGQITAVVGLAPMLAPVLGGWVVTVSGWRAIYGAQAACGLLLLLATAAAFRESLPSGQRRGINPAAILASYRTVLRNRPFRGNTLLYAFSFACMFAFISSAPAVLMDSMGLTPPVFSLVFGLTSCCTILGSVANGRLNARQVASDQVTRWGVVVLCAAALALAGVVLSGLAGVATVLPPVALVMFAFGLVGPSANHEALGGLAVVAGSAAGVLRCTQMVAGATASLLVAFLRPLGAPVLVMSVLMLATSLFAAAALLWVRRAPSASARAHS